MAKKNPLVKRKRAIDKLMDQFRSKPFALGSADCVKLTRTHLVNMGHKLPSTGHYKTTKEAITQLKKQGARNLEELWDKYLERIPPAMMLPGDIGMPPSDPDAPAAALGTTVVKVAGGNKYLGYRDDVPYLCVLDISQIDIAWRA